MVGAVEAALLRAGSSRHEANALLREWVAASLFLRWFDQAEPEQMTTGILKDRDYRTLLPPELRWRHVRLDGAQHMTSLLLTESVSSEIGVLRSAVLCKSCAGEL